MWPSCFTYELKRERLTYHNNHIWISYKGLPPTKPKSGQEGPNIPHKKSRFSASREASAKGVEEDDPEARIDSKFH